MKFLLTRAVVPNRIKHAIRARLTPATVTSLNCKFLVNPADNYSEYRLWLKGTPPEARETVYLRDVLQCRELTIVDVGANAGLVSIPILQSLPRTAHLLAFEPNPVMFDRLMDNLELNNLENFTCYDVAISDKKGEGHLHLPLKENLGEGRLNLRYKDGLPDRIPVDIYPLTQYTNNIPRGTFGLLKIDVEGFEDRVLKPLLEQPEPNLPEHIYIEVAHKKLWKYPVFQKLKENGYELLQDFGNNQLFQLRKA